MNKKRIVVTGIGVSSCFGTDVELFYNKLLNGESGVRTITHFTLSEDYNTRFAASIESFDPGEYIDRKLARRVDRFIAYAMVAGKKCIEFAGFTNPDTLNALDKSRCGILIGSGMGGMDTFSNGIELLKERGLKRMPPFFIPNVITNMAGGLLAIDLGFMGPNYSISSACATGNHCIVAAANHILNGDADMMLCGGVEAAVSPIGLGGFCVIKALSQRNDNPAAASRPWDKNRDGFVMGEGAGIILLETLESAQKRGATILAEYRGGGATCDAYHMTQLKPDGSGIVACLNKALDSAGMKPEEVNHINAHATSTEAGDMVEVSALKQVFKHHKDVVLNATKSIIGHCLGAAGGIEAVAVIQAIRKGEIHPTLNLEDPEEGLDFIVPKKALKHSVSAAVSNSFGFGGHNAVVIFSPLK